MSINTSKSGFQNLLSALLSVANQPQNTFLGPEIFSSMVNTVTSFLIDKCVELYPSSPSLLDIVAPFVKVSVIAPSGGVFQLPDDYRNIIGAPSIIVKNDKRGECGDVGVPINTAQQFLSATLKGGCSRRPITIVAQSEFDYLTTSSYKSPTFWDPIGFNAGVDDVTKKKIIRICPTDLSKIYLLYVKQEKVYNYGYILNPDDTFYLNPDTTVDTEWGNEAFTPLFKGLNHLFGIYSRDKQFSDWAISLSQISIV